MEPETFVPSVWAGALDAQIQYFVGLDIVTRTGAEFIVGRFRVFARVDEVSQAVGSMFFVGW